MNRPVPFVRRAAIACAAVLSALACASPAAAAEQRGRLSIDVEVVGDHRWSDGRLGESHTRSRHHWQFTAALQADRELQADNPLAPDHAQKMMARGATVTKQVQKAQSNPKPAAAPAQSMADMMAMAQKAQAQCGSDTACLQRFAVEMQAAQAAQFGADPATQAKLASYGHESMACERQHTGNRKAIAACQNAARVRAGAEADPEEAAGRFQHFFGFDGCGATLRAVVDSKAIGHTVDTGKGDQRYPLRVIHTADDRGDDDELRLACTLNQIVYDTQARRITTQSVTLPRARGTTVREQRGQTTREDRVEMALPAPVVEWVIAQLRDANASGSARTSLPAPADGIGTTTGRLDVKLSWKFERL